MARKSFSVAHKVPTCGINSLSTATELSESTNDFYESHAREYFDRTVSANLSSVYDQFLKFVTPNGRILDLGCGSGRDLKAMRDRGFKPVGIDASLSLAKLAAEFSGAHCLTMRFEDFEVEQPFDAVWACASLIHIPKTNLSSILNRIYDALISGGMLFVSVKVGDGEELLPDGRFFAYYTPPELEFSLSKAGFAIDYSWISSDSLRPAQDIRWLNIIAHREETDPISPSSEPR